MRAEARLEHLEHLVQELSQQRATSENHPLTQNDLEAQGVGGTFYNGATHWSAMLEDIDEIHYAIRDAEYLAYSGNDDSGNEATRILFGDTGHLKYEEVLQLLRLYQLFWNNPLTTSPIWTSLLFSILDISLKPISPSSDVGINDDGSDRRFDVAAAHCLSAGGIHRPQKFVVEAVLLFAQARCLATSDMNPEIAILFGLIVRLATLMGYHKDASTYRQGIAAFDGEMRRCTWSFCMQLDLLVSFQFGLPSNVQFPTWDTRIPTNLLDSDFDEDTAQLPPGRLVTEPTEILFYIAKHRFMAIFERVIRHVLSATDSPDGELEAIDREVRDTYEALPTYLRPRSMTDSVMDSTSIKITRMCVSSIYQKCLCVLHRN